MRLSDRPSRSTAPPPWLGTLPASLVDESEFRELVQQGIQDLPLGLTVDQAGAEFAELGRSRRGRDPLETPAGPVVSSID